MIHYPHLVAALADADLDEISTRAGLNRSVIEAWADGAVAPLHLRGRVAAALGVDVDEFGLPLFRLDDELEQAMPAGAARFVTDPETLRIIDGAAREQS